MTIHRRWWWIGGAILIVLTAALYAASPTSQLTEVLFVFAILWLMASSVVLMWWLWRWMTYRVGVRLSITYLLVGVLPVLFAAGFVAIGLYIMMGQYTSVRIGAEIEKYYFGITRVCDVLMDEARNDGAASAVESLEAIEEDQSRSLSTVLWRARFGDLQYEYSDDEDLPSFNWLDEGTYWNIAHHRGKVYAVTAQRNSTGDWVAALIPFNDVTAEEMSAQWWFDVAFVEEDLDQDLESAMEETESTTDNEEQNMVDGDGSVRLQVGDATVTGNAIWPTWTEEDEGLFSKPWVIWFRMVSNLVDLESGEPLEEGRSIALLRTSPQNVWDDFTLSEYEVRTELWGALAGLGAMFLLGYGLVLAAAATVIVSIARSTARLSKGARQVELGNLDYRVPVKRRDQLGDLAKSFNTMTDSVQSMLEDVAEKERLASELELAREIQVSLLPARHLEVGPLTVRATFQPAAEVGGDYFDVFSINGDRMVVAIGDVAGHGLSTGLLMASLKSSVAALVREGYGGSELIDKVNLVLTENRPDRTMVTLSVIDVNLAEDQISIANAGHPPGYLIGTDGSAEEILISSLPLGTRLCRPVSVERPFPVNSRLLLYSDGLVEALSDDGEPFGYERLQETIESVAGIAGVDLIERVHEALRLHSGETPPADDLTLLMIERNG